LKKLEVQWFERIQLIKTTAFVRKDRGVIGLDPFGDSPMGKYKAL
jgi:hypothetical protein